MVVPSLKRLFGGMNKDSDLLDIKQGDTLDALNIRTLTAHGSTTGSAELVEGNTFAFDLGSVSQQNKIYIISFNLATDLIYTFRVLDQNRKAITATLSFDGSAYLNNLHGFWAAVVLPGINSALTTAGQTYTISQSPALSPDNSGNLTIELTTVLGRDYIVQSNNVTIVQEAIDLSLTGNKVDVGSYDLLGDLFILSTPVKKDSTTVSISSISNTTPLVVTTASSHGLLTGENILIKAVTGAVNANGYWIVNVINSTQIILLGSTFSSPYISGGTITSTPNGYGEIGVAQKNMSDGTWTYIKLLASKEFKLRTLFQAEMRAEIDGLRKSIYWTDNNDAYRVMYYYGNYVTNGFLAQYNTNGIYALNTLDSESKLFLPPPSVTINITQEEGGNLKCGNYRYAVRLVVEGDTATEWSYLSNPISVYKTPVSSNLDAQYVVGGTANEVSTKVNVIEVNDIPVGVYNFIELAAIQYVGLVPIGSIVIRQRMPQNISFATLRHTGSSINEIELDLETLSQVFASITKGQNLLLLDNRLVVSNYYTQLDYDLSTMAQQITCVVRRLMLPSIGYIADPNGLILEEQLKPTNVFNYTGYMDNETYRTAFRIKWKKSSWSVPYFIKDITINTANGLPDYSLTTTNGSHIYVRFLQFSNVNLDYQLSDGTILRDLIDDDGTPNIQFLRAEMNETTWEVLCTGVLAGSQSAAPNQPNTNFIANPPTLFGGSQTKGYFYSPDVYFREAYPSNTNGLVMKFLDTPLFKSGFTSGSNNLVEYQGNFSGSSYVNQTIVSSSIVDLSSLFWGNNIFELVTGTLTPPLANGAIDVGLNYIQLFRPKPNKFGTVETTRYVTTGNPFRSLGVTPSSTFDVFGGDTFTQKSYKVVKQVNANSGYGISFFSQNRVNSQMHLAEDTSGNDVFTIPGTAGTSTSGILKFLGLQSANLISNPYNTGYNIQNLLQFFIGFDPALPQQNYFPVRIAWSELKTINGISDAYRIILPGNFTDIFPSAGAISHMEAWNSILLTWQPRMFMRQYFNGTGTLVSSVGELLIGNGSVMARDGEDLSMYGCSHKWAVVKGLTPGGKDFLNWINAEFKKLVRFGLDGTVVISDEKFMQSFFADNLNFALSYFTPAYNYGITGVYNTRFFESIFTIRCINPSAVLAVEGESIVVGNLRYGFLYSFDKVPLIYKAKDNFVLDASNYPGSGENWTTYWELLGFLNKEGYNLYTVVSNEYINKITTFYTFKPKIYLKYRDGYLSPSATTESKIYEHDRGVWGEWYKELLTASGTFNHTQESKSILGFGTSFNTLFPSIKGIVYYLIIAGAEYEIESVQSDTNLTLAEAVTSTGTITVIDYARANSEDGYIESVVNDNPDVIKGWRALRLNSENKPPRVEFKTETVESFLIEDDFEERELMMYGAIKMDSTISADNPTGSNELDTSSIWGKYLRTKIFFKKRNYQKIYDFLVKFAPKKP